MSKEQRERKPSLYVSERKCPHFGCKVPTLWSQSVGTYHPMHKGLSEKQHPPL